MKHRKGRALRRRYGHAAAGSIDARVEKLVAEAEAITKVIAETDTEMLSEQTARDLMARLHKALDALHGLAAQGSVRAHQTAERLEEMVSEIEAARDYIDPSQWTWE